MQTTPATNLPVKATDRILYLDILRGIAILFIFLANITYLSGSGFYSDEYAASFATAKLDHALDVFFFILIDGKFYSIFSILFGIGFVVQYNNMKKNAWLFPPFFRGRMLGLLLIGSFHMFFVWVGDILTLYALLGLVLIWFRNFDDRRLLRWAAVLLVVPVVHWMAMHFTGYFYPYALFDFVNAHAEAQGMELTDWRGVGRPTFNPSDFLAIEDFNQRQSVNIGLPAYRLALILLEGRIFKVLALFLIGIWAGRQILDNNILENRNFLKKVAFWGLTIGLPMNVLRAVVEFGDHSGVVWDFLFYVFYAAGVVPLACGYAAVVALMVITRPKLLHWIAPVGRTALSNYLFQSVIAIYIFCGIGLGYTGQFGFTLVVGIALVVFAWQVLFSTVWLRYFRFGPVEWIWRQMTYGKWIDIRKKKTKDAVPAAISIVEP